MGNIIDKLRCGCTNCRSSCILTSNISFSEDELEKKDEAELDENMRELDNDIQRLDRELNQKKDEKNKIINQLSKRKQNSESGESGESGEKK